jgi:hypothetical protein
MQFRWVALISLWALLSGPAFGPPSTTRPLPQRNAYLKGYHSPFPADVPK